MYVNSPAQTLVVGLSSTREGGCWSTLPNANGKMNLPSTTSLIVGLQQTGENIGYDGRIIPKNSTPGNQGLTYTKVSQNLKTKRIYDYDWTHRCDICDVPCKSATGVKIHHTKVHKTPKKNHSKVHLQTVLCKFPNGRHNKTTDRVWPVRMNR